MGLFHPVFYNPQPNNPPSPFLLPPNPERSAKNPHSCLEPPPLHLGPRSPRAQAQEEACCPCFGGKYNRKYTPIMSIESRDSTRLAHRATAPSQQKVLVLEWPADLEWASLAVCPVLSLAVCPVLPLAVCPVLSLAVCPVLSLAV